MMKYSGSLNIAGSTAVSGESSDYGSRFCVFQYVAKFTDTEIPQKMC